MIDGDRKTRRKGRPTKFEELEIQEILWSYFENDTKARVTSRLSGIHRNTVDRHFNKWHDEFKEIQDNKFIEMCKARKSHAILVCQNQLLKLERLQKNYEKQMENSIAKNNGLPQLDMKEYKQGIDNINAIIKLTLILTALANTPTADITLAQKVEELVKQHVLA